MDHDSRAENGECSRIREGSKAFRRTDLLPTTRRVRQCHPASPKPECSAAHGWQTSGRESVLWRTRQYDLVSEFLGVGSVSSEGVADNQSIPEIGNGRELPSG